MILRLALLGRISHCAFRLMLQKAVRLAPFKSKTATSASVLAFELTREDEQQQFYLSKFRTNVI